MLRRRKKEHPAPATAEAPWRSRVDEARALIRSSESPSWVDGSLDEVDRSIDEIERGLLAAEADREKLAAAIAQLDPDRARRELKDALRSGAAAEDRLDMLRRRHDAVNDLMNRRERLGERIDTAVIDLELLAVRAVEAGTGASSRDSVDEQLGRLRDDLRALETAHEELQDL